MACFLIPAAEAVITTVAAKAIKSKEASSHASESKTAFSTKLGWLNKLSWGGCALLAFEHVWHGEVIPAFPFITAVKAGETVEMLSELKSAGVGMALLVTAVWAGMVVVSSIAEAKAVNATKEEA